MSLSGPASMSGQYSRDLGPTGMFSTTVECSQFLELPRSDMWGLVRKSN